MKGFTTDVKFRMVWFAEEYNKRADWREFGVNESLVQYWHKQQQQKKNLSEQSKL